MGKHRNAPVNGFPTQTVLLGSAVAAGTMCIALAGAGTAEAKTHHHDRPPGNPFSAPVFSASAQTRTSTGPSFTAHQNVVRPPTTSIVIHSSGTGGNSTGGPATSGGETGKNLGGATAASGGPKTSTGSAGASGGGGKTGTHG